MKKGLLMLALVAATSMVALAHGNDKSKKSCCSKDSKKEASAKSCCSKDEKKTASASSNKSTKEKSEATDKANAPK